MGIRRFMMLLVFSAPLLFSALRIPVRACGVVCSACAVSWKVASGWCQILAIQQQSEAHRPAHRHSLLDAAG